MKMSMLGIVLWLAIIMALGFVCGWSYAAGKAVDRCGECPDRVDDVDDSAVLPPRVLRAIRDAAAAVDTCDGSRVSGDEPPVCESDLDEMIADGIDGPLSWVEPDIIAQIETGHLPPEERDAAIGAAGERGRHQITEGAWNDAMAWLQRNRGWRVRWDWQVDAHDAARSTVVASVIVNEMLPRWLTCQRLFRGDETGPAPDCVDTRVAAYNCGVRRVRKAHQWSRLHPKDDWRHYTPESTQEYLSRYHAAAAKSETTKVTKATD